MFVLGSVVLKPLLLRATEVGGTDIAFATLTPERVALTPLLLTLIKVGVTVTGVGDTDARNLHV